jgi:hypothetical protein
MVMPHDLHVRVCLPGSRFSADSSPVIGGAPRTLTANGRKEFDEVSASGSTEEPASGGNGKKRRNPRKVVRALLVVAARIILWFWPSQD